MVAFGTLRLTADTLPNEGEVTIDAERAGLPRYTLVIQRINRLDASERSYDEEPCTFLPLNPASRSLLSAAVLSPAD
jgi:hypothetical protein